MGPIVGVRCFGLPGLMPVNWGYTGSRASGLVLVQLLPPVVRPRVLRVFGDWC